MDKIGRRQLFFERSLPHENVRKTIAGRNEQKIIECLNSVGYIEGKDYIRQYPFYNRYVLDFAFPREQVCVEVDGPSHDGYKQIIADKKRDDFVRLNNWVVLRIRDKIFDKRPSFFKSLIKEIVDERFEQYNIGTLYPLELQTYIKEDYE
mgnify:CR=1 FL=1